MKPSTNIQTPEDVTDKLIDALIWIGEQDPFWVEQAEKRFDFDLGALIVPSPSPVPTDDGLEMAARYENALDQIDLALHGWPELVDLPEKWGEPRHRDDLRVSIPGTAEQVYRICDALATVNEIVNDSTFRSRALKGNSLPAPDEVEIIARSICEAFRYKWNGLPESRNRREDGTEWPVHASFTNPSKDGFRCIVRDALAKANLLQSTTPPAASPVQVDGGWQPIESAPKDGTAILVSDGRNVSVAIWDNESEAADNARWYISDWHNDPIHLRGGYRSTHWRPLPEPPANLSDASGEKKS